MRSFDELDFYEILNLTFDCNDKDVENAYLCLMTIYSASSMASYGAISATERRSILNRIQAGYETLKTVEDRNAYQTTTLGLTDEAKKDEFAKGLELRKELSPLPLNPPVTGAKQTRREKKKGVEERSGDVSNQGVITGAHLRNIREAKGATLEEISEKTKVKKAYLDAIEREDKNSFPAPVFMKGFIKSYAKALGLNPEEISEKYRAK